MCLHKVDWSIWMVLPTAWRPGVHCEFTISNLFAHAEERSGYGCVLDWRIVSATARDSNTSFGTQILSSSRHRKDRNSWFWAKSWKGFVITRAWRFLVPQFELLITPKSVVSWTEPLVSERHLIIFTSWRLNEFFYQEVTNSMFTSNFWSSKFYVMELPHVIITARSGLVLTVWVRKSAVDWVFDLFGSNNRVVVTWTWFGATLLGIVEMFYSCCVLWTDCCISLMLIITRPWTSWPSCFESLIARHWPQRLLHLISCSNIILASARNMQKLLVVDEMGFSFLFTHTVTSRLTFINTIHFILF